MSTASKKKKKIPNINTIESLYKHLQWALEVEHFTIPPYLCALWSLQDGQNQEAREVIHSVVMEEMLHMTLVANLMNAVGIRPEIDKPGFIPVYPEVMPHSGKDEKYQVHLAKFSKDTIKTFMNIEKPQKAGDPPQDGPYDTIGQLYDAVAEGLEYLVDIYGEDEIFIGNPEDQIKPEYYYGGGGFVFQIANLKDAQNAVREISEQGEGSLPHGDKLGSVFDGDDHYGQPPEPAHYYRYEEIILGQKYIKGDKPFHPKKRHSGPTGAKFTVDWDMVHNMQLDPKAKHYPEGSPIRAKMDAFNQRYTHMLQKIEKAYSGEPHLLKEAVGEMYKLKYLGKELMVIPSGKGNTTVGPSFEYHP